MAPRVASVTYALGQSGNSIEAGNFDSASDPVPATTCNFTPLDPASTGRFVTTLPLLGEWTLDWGVASQPFDFSGLRAIKVSFPDVSATLGLLPLAAGLQATTHAHESSRPASPLNVPQVTFLASSVDHSNSLGWTST